MAAGLPPGPAIQRAACLPQVFPGIYPATRKGGIQVYKRIGLPVLLALLVLLSACGRENVALDPSGCLLWFPVDDRLPGYGHGPALSSESYDDSETSDPGTLLNALLAGPSQDGLRSPFPRGVTLQHWAWDESRPGVLLVSLSEQYGALADVSLSLADYCIVLTLSQIKGVDNVEITAGGHWVSYRSHQLLSTREAVLRDELADTALDLS